MKEENILFVSLIAAESGKFTSLFSEKFNNRLAVLKLVHLLVNFASIKNMAVGSHITVGAAVA